LHGRVVPCKLDEPLEILDVSLKIPKGLQAAGSAGMLS
jgi:hypothetical protein